MNELNEKSESALDKSEMASSSFLSILSNTLTKPIFNKSGEDIETASETTRSAFNTTLTKPVFNWNYTVDLVDTDTLSIKFQVRDILTKFQNALKENQINADESKSNKNTILVSRMKITELPVNFFQNFPGLFNAIENALNIGNEAISNNRSSASPYLKK